MSKLSDEIKIALYRKLGHAQISFIEDDSMKSLTPLFLVMTINPDVAAFALLSDDLEVSYKSALSSFRKLYAQNSSIWADYDLTLVLCIAEEQFNIDFASEKEQDGYFCRKFVLKLGNAEELSKELSHLPFIPPLGDSEINAGQSVTIPAKMLLEEHGFSPSLATDITKFKEKRAERIIGDIVNKLYGEISWEKPDTKKSLNPINSDARNYLRIKELEIHNFKAYRGNHRFDLDADLIVLYGPNGLGKTSFFDAIDFVCTGGESKIEQKVGPKESKRIVKSLKNLDASDNDPVYVGSYFTNGEVQHYIKRTITDRTNASWDNIEADRIHVLKKLTGFYDEALRISTANLIQLFRASHLYGQDFQALTSNLLRNSTLSADTVSKLFALQDYVDALRKTGEIIDSLEKDIQSHENETEMLGALQKDTENTILQLEGLVKAVEQPTTLNQAGKELLQQLSRENNIAIEPSSQEIKKEHIIQWRIATEARLGEIVRLIRQFDNIENGFRQYDLKRKELEGENKEKTKITNSLVDLKKIYSDKKKLLDELNIEMQNEVSAEGKLRIATENLSWLVLAQKENEQLQADINKEDESIKLINEIMIKLVPALEEVSSLKSIISRQIESISKQLVEFESTDKGLNNILKILSEWGQTSIEVETLQKAIANIDKSIEDARKRKVDLGNNVSGLTREHNNQIKRVASVQTKQTDLSNLLDNIEQ